MAEPTVQVPVSLIESWERRFRNVADMPGTADELRAYLSQPTPTADPECTCYPTPEHLHTTHYGATEPGSTLEPNPECPLHFPSAEPPRIEDLAPGTTFYAWHTGTWKRFEYTGSGRIRFVNSGSSFAIVGPHGPRIDLSTIRDVTPPRGSDG